MSLVHSQFFYIAVIGVLAHMRCNVWQLYTIDITLPWVNRYCYKWYSIVIVEKQSTVTINGLYILGVLLPHKLLKQEKSNLVFITMGTKSKA